MEIPLSKLILRYLVFVGIPYLLARRIEKFLMNRIDIETKDKLNNELKKFPDVDVSESSKDGLGNRGGAMTPILIWIYKIIASDFAAKTAIAGAIGATIWGSTADEAAGALAKYGAAILNAPGNKFRKLVNKLKGLEHHERDIREIILDKNLTISDKLELFKIKVEQAVRELKGPRRVKFILFALAILLFFFGGGALFKPGHIIAFSSVLERLRALLGVETTNEDLKNALIEVYREYNAPLPKELLPEEIQKVINSLE
uniref:Uncharacterized protein n=1 Tax=Nitzschia supralitorea TaxID=303403 RepID=A0A8F0WHT2_9STRA|nr:hypothetical protein KYU99_pgp036 [Nitzschia supralitorea]QWM93206.1 hypothetical protein [Nitzschia supralitorea]